jgi:hypothetical protein
MLIGKASDVRSSEITDETFYLRRREFMRLAGGAALVTAASPWALACAAGATDEPADTGTAVQAPLSNYTPRVVSTDEPLNTFDQITSYNNFYEFGLDKGIRNVTPHRMTTSPWTVKIDGHCHKPADYPSRTSSARTSSRSASTGCAASRRGRWSSRGSASRSPRSSSARSRPARPRSSPSDAESPLRDARPCGSLPRLAVRRGPAHGRGDAPAGSSSAWGCTAK